MKTLLSYLCGILFILLLIFINISRNKSNNEVRLLTELQDLKDSIKYIESLPPDTVVLDPILVHDTVIYEHTTFTSEPNSQARVYSDSLVNDSINVKISILADNVYSINYKYSPIILKETIEIYKPKPYYITKTKEVKVDRRSLYFTTGLGFKDVFVGKVGLVYTTKNKQLFGAEVIRFGEENIGMISYGIRF